MNGLKAAVVGCRPRGRAHVRELAKLPGVRVVAAVDMVQDRAREVANEFAPEAKIYSDLGEMLNKKKPDLVAICTSASWRLEPVRLCVEAGVQAIQCEKPMAVSWQEAVEMHDLAEQAGVLLAFCHQRRFAPQFLLAKSLLEHNEIGELVRIDGYCPNIFDWGTHWLDLMRFWTDDPAAKWVMGQVDRSDPYEQFGQVIESASTLRVGLQNDVEFALHTKRSLDHPHILLRVIGREGVIEVQPRDEPKLRCIHEKALGWQVPDCAPPDDGLDDTGRALAHLIDCLEQGISPTHGSSQALQATELIFAGYLSSLERTRIHLPLGARQITLDQAISNTLA